MEPSTTSPLARGETANVNLLSSLNNQITNSNTKLAGQIDFYNCLAANQFQNSNTLTAFLYSTNRDTSQPLIVTVDFGVLSAYTSQLWQRAREDQNEMRNLVALHKRQDSACFRQKLNVMTSKAVLKPQDKPSSVGTPNKPGVQEVATVSISEIEDYKNSAKLLLQIYDYLNSTLERTDYAELSEQLARDHIPIRVLLPTT